MFFQVIGPNSGTGNILGGGPVLGVGILRKYGELTFLSAATSIITTLTSVLTVAFACRYSDSIVEISGFMQYSSGSATNDNDGFLCYLYVDGVNSGITAVSGWIVQNTVLSLHFKFLYDPGDDDSHNYSIRVSGTSGVIVAKNAWVQPKELAPNL